MVYQYLKQDATHNDGTISTIHHKFGPLCLSNLKNPSLKALNIKFFIAANMCGVTGDKTKCV